MITKIGKELVQVATLLAKSREFKYRNLEKYAATRYKELLSGLSAESKARLADVAKPLEEELAGIRRGTENMIARAGYTMRPAVTKEEIEWVKGEGGGLTDPDTKTVWYLDPAKLKGGRNAEVKQKDVPFYDTARKNYPYVLESLLRHEAYEADEDAKGIKRRVRPYTRIFTSQNLHTPSMKELRRHLEVPDATLEAQAWDEDIVKLTGSPERAKSYLPKPIGKHMNLNVLAREAKFLNRSYHSHMANTIKNRRRRLGEADILADNMGLDRQKGDIFTTTLTNKDYKDLAIPKKNIAFSDEFDDITGKQIMYNLHISTLNKE